MKYLYIFFITVFFTACVEPFEKDYYERISKIKFPNKYKVLENFDNGEWLIATVLSVDSIELKEFVLKNEFDTVSDIMMLNFFSNSGLTKYPFVLDSTSKIYYIRKSINKNDITYIADLTKNILWAEISYPDYGGQ